MLLRILKTVVMLLSLEPLGVCTKRVNCIWSSQSGIRPVKLLPFKLSSLKDVKLQIDGGISPKRLFWAMSRLINLSSSPTNVKAAKEPCRPFRGNANEIWKEFSCGRQVMPNLCVMLGWSQLWAQEKSFRGGGVTIDNSVGLTASIHSAELHPGNVFSSYGHLCHCRILAVCAVLLYLRLLHQCQFFFNGKQLLKEGDMKPGRTEDVHNTPIHSCIIRKSGPARTQNAIALRRPLQQEGNRLTKIYLWLLQWCNIAFQLIFIGCTTNFFSHPKAQPESKWCCSQQKFMKRTDECIFPTFIVGYNQFWPKPLPLHFWCGV